MEALAAERTAAAAEAHRLAAQLRRDLEERANAPSAAADAQRAVEEERDKVAVLEEELRRRRGIRALFAKAPGRGKTRRPPEDRGSRGGSGIERRGAESSARGSAGISLVRVRHRTAPRERRGDAGGDSAAAPRRLFEHGTAGAPAEVIDHLDSPGRTVQADVTAATRRDDATSVVCSERARVGARTRLVSDAIPST